jgi:aldoxime dehydratase
MMARSTTRSNQRPDTLMQDRICQVDETSCNARPDHTSGQDWGDTDASERKMYLDDVEPVLREGMDFLRDSGRSIGCYANRYMTVVASDGTPIEKSYGMSWWKSLAALERWAESHPTHVRIFGAAMKYLSTLGPSAKLRLYHEVTVARAEEAFFEYVDCHPQTGMLNAVQAVDAA